MKIFLKIRLIAFALIISNLLIAQSQNGFTLSGKVDGLVNGEKVYFALWNSKSYHYFGDYLTWDSTIVQDGKFYYSGIVPDGGPRRYYLQFQKAKKIIDLWIDNGEKIYISYDSNINKFPGTYINHLVSIEGSPSTYSRAILEPARMVYYQSMLGINDAIVKIQDSIGFNGLLLEGLFLAKEKLNRIFYLMLLSDRASRDRDVSKCNVALLGEFDPSGHAAFWAEIYNHLDEQKKNTFHGKWLKEISKLSVGQPFPEFTLPDIQGKVINSKQIIPKGRITIIHFWSANSQNRKKYQDEVRVMYKKYHDKGLNVIGVFHNDMYDKPEGKYVDVSAQWKDIVKNEQFPWVNVADLNGKDGPVEKVYREAGDNNTTNVILDAQGRIIAWEAKGATLQYYLWKHFGE